MEFEAFLFDLDGTLIDSLEDIALACNKTLQDLNMPQRQKEEIRKHIGSGAYELFRGLLEDEALIPKAVEIFKDYYAKSPIAYTKLFNGTIEVLELLKAKNKKMVVISNKPLELSIIILKALNVDKYFEDIVGPETYKERKPSAVPILKALEKLNISPSQAVVIGDTHADIESAKNANSYSALASWGYVKLKDVKPDFILDNIYDIKTFL